MAYQAPAAVRFCGRCGAQIAPGATFCGRCGTPVAAQAVAPAAAGPLAYYYPQAPPMQYPTGRQRKLAPAAIAGGLIAIVVVIAVVISAFAVAQYAGGSRSTCRSNCSPKFVSPLPEEASYTSSTYKFQVNYSKAWTVRSQDGGQITLGTKLGSVQVMGMKGGSPDQAVQSTVNGLPSSRFQDVTLVSNLKGAHLADQDGLGSVYAANFVGTSQTATKIRFAVIAATRGGVTVVVLAIDPADPKNSPNGMPEGQEFDYLCTEFVWGG